ncbi:NAD(P)-dependent oxidoreductase [Longispora albida]|uniref:NAD(P)-dependent oxidoreductase n=1 Tax=Longispora albida TaxID=203523 RepID=UPI000476DA5F|nr:NAD(P)-binding domain-containing protein [Longispora albida]
MSPVRQVSVIGLGLMGSALAGALLDAGQAVTVWNRSAAKAGPLTARGASLAASVSEAVAASPIVVVCVADNATVESLLGPVAAGLGGKTLVNLTNGTPEQARALAAWAAGAGVTYVDGGIMAVPQMIGQPGALVLYSGESEPPAVLSAFGKPVYLGTDPGLAALYDLALLSGMYGLFAGFYQAMGLVRSAGAGAAEFMELLGPWLSAMSGMLPAFAAEIDAAAYHTDVASLAVNADALANIGQASQDQGVSFDLLQPVKELIERRVAAGHGADSLSSLVDTLITKGNS